jgi:magnesium chelatase family protein
MLGPFCNQFLNAFWRLTGARLFVPHILMIGSPGAGKSMLAARLPSILPPLSPSELLEVSMIASVAGEIQGGALTARRPFRSPHHSASMAALTGGGMRA